MANIHNSTKEVWKDIIGYEGLYKICCDSRVLNILTNKILKSRIDTRGYFTVALRKDGKNSIHSIHRLLAKSFIPNHENHPLINHKNEIKTDNKLTNLEWCSNLYNTREGCRKNRKRGKVSMEELHKMYLMAQQMPLKDVAPKFGMARNSLNILLTFIHPNY